jgi:hypothetical protein
MTDTNRKQAYKPFQGDEAYYLFSYTIFKSNCFIHSSYPVLLLCGGFSFSLDLYTFGRTPWSSNRPVARPLPKYRTTETQNKRTQTKHQCPKWDLNSRSRLPSERRQFMLPNARYRDWPKVIMIFLICITFIFVNIFFNIYALIN